MHINFCVLRIQNITARAGGGAGGRGVIVPHLLSKLTECVSRPLTSHTFAKTIFITFYKRYSVGASD